MQLSLVIPCYNEEENIDFFYQYVKEHYKKIDRYELIFVDDGSTDNSFYKLKTLAQTDKKRVKVVSFSRNFGKEAAMLAGLKEASGKYVGIIDVDMQQDPDMLLQMMDILEHDDGYDVIATYQEERQDGKILSFFKRSFYSLINDLSEVEFRQSASDFRLFRKKVVDAILLLPEQVRFSKGIFSYVGFPTYYLLYNYLERHAGASKFKFKKLFKYGMAGIISFSLKPLSIPFYLGCLFLGLSLFSLICFLCSFHIELGIVTLILFTAGIQFLVIALICVYLSQMFIASKNRPLYIVKDKLNIK